MIKGVKGQTVMTAQEVEQKFEYTTKDIVKLFKYTKELRTEIERLKADIVLLQHEDTVEVKTKWYIRLWNYLKQIILRFKK